jgi:NAD(P)-dependent dehydrogenase (short-subunit alcohol dehydrogenase family)
MPSFIDRIALITGAGSGLGREIARILSREGAVIAAVDINGEPLGKLTGELPAGRSEWALADVTDRTALNTAVAQLQEKLGPIDLLVACAGVGFETTALVYSAEEVERIICVNLIGVSNSIGAVLPGMLERRSGHLVAISSLASYRGLPRMAGYCASKAGVNALLDAIRVEVQPFGVAVTTVCPGWVKTPLTANLELPMPGILEVEDAARRIVDAIRRRRPFFAFPRRSARQVRLLGLLPSGPSDWLIGRLLRSLTAKKSS